MNAETITKYYTQAVETFGFTEVNGEAFWATVALILAEEGLIDKENFADAITTLSALPAYASNMEKAMIKCKALNEKAKASSLAEKYAALAKSKG
jgi:hypothetical protein